MRNMKRLVFLLLISALLLPLLGCGGGDGGNAVLAGDWVASNFGLATGTLVKDGKLTYLTEDEISATKMSFDKDGSFTFTFRDQTYSGAVAYHSEVGEVKRYDVEMSGGETGIIGYAPASDINPEFIIMLELHMDAGTLNLNLKRV